VRASKTPGKVSFLLCHSEQICISVPDETLSNPLLDPRCSPCRLPRARYAELRFDGDAGNHCPPPIIGSHLIDRWFIQVLCGILPISRVSAIPSCIHFAAERLPLEHVYKLVHPTLSAPPIEDKRTWREGMRSNSLAEKGKPLVWTAMDILIAYADLKGWVTAKAGRPDVHRAGNASREFIFIVASIESLTYIHVVLRSLAEGKIGWSFWPPETNGRARAADVEEGAGIWIPHINLVDEESEEDSEAEDENKSNNSEIENVGEEEEEDSSDDRTPQGFGRFGALTIAGDDEE
jgi:hypothetical protein